MVVILEAKKKKEGYVSCKYECTEHGFIKNGWIALAETLAGYDARKIVEAARTILEERAPRCETCDQYGEVK